MMDLNEVTRFVLHQEFQSRNDIIIKLSTFLGNNLINVYKGTNTPSVVIAFKADKDYVIKTEYSSTVPKKTISQINWYQFKKSLRRDFSMVPRFIKGTTNKHIAFYYLEYLNGYIPLDQYLINNPKGLDEQIIYKYFNSLLDIILDLFYSSKILIEEGIWHKYFFNRAGIRLEEAKQFSYLKDLLEEKEIIINDRVYENFPQQLKTTEEKIMNFGPRKEKVGFQHGDLHFGNVLIKGEDLKILDPNGSLVLPYIYDYGKLLQGIHGGYDLIHNKHFTLSKVRKNRFIFKFTPPGVYQSLFSILKTKISKETLVQSLIAEVYHFISMLSHHAHDKEETVALYLQAVILFDELRDMMDRQRNGVNDR